MTIVKFEVGKAYQNHRTGDRNLTVSIKVLSRTEKTIRAETDEGVKTLRITLHNGIEQVKPEGSFSKAPIVSAIVRSTRRELNRERRDEGLRALDCPAYTTAGRRCR